MRSGWSLPGESPSYDWTTDFDSWDRCTTRGMPSSMMPYRYNGGFKIWQAPGVVVFDLEMIHDSRVIPTDGRPRLNAAHKEYMGESPRTLGGQHAGRRNHELQRLARADDQPGRRWIAGGNRFPHSDQMKTTERITRLNDDMWLYEIKTEDPVVLTGSFTVRYPMRNDPQLRVVGIRVPRGQHDRPELHDDVASRARQPGEREAKPIQVSADIANALAGKWVGRPAIKTIEYDIELEFVKNADGSVLGKLDWHHAPEGTADQSAAAQLRDEGSPDQLRVPRTTQSWNFAGELSATASTITGVTASAQGGAGAEFPKR
jgi:hypothetical protein